VEDHNITNSLIKKAMRGNAEAYGQLIENHKDYLYRTAYLYTKNEQAALDAVGDCILSGFQSIKTLREPAYFKTWLTRILLNVANDSFRKGKNLILTNEIEKAGFEKDISIEERLDLYQAIENLPEKYRSVIILKYFNELKVSEIAYTMDIPEGSVKAYLARARKDLRIYLKEDYFYAN